MSIPAEGRDLVEEQDVKRLEGVPELTEDCHPLQTVLLIQAACASALIAGVCTGPSLILQPLQALRYIVAVMLPATALAYSLLPVRRADCSVQKALIRGLMGFPAGVAIAFLVATIFGAPLSPWYMWKTLHWASVMSVLVVVPPVTVFGVSMSDWRHLFVTQTRPTRQIEIAISFSGHGAIIGAWLGVWPTPLDWDRPWQAWPISCTFGAIGGYILSSCAAMLICCLVSNRPNKLD